MGRQPCCDKLGVKKGPWTAEEDKKLINFIITNGHCCWRAVPKLAGLLRCGKSCRLRWTNYLRPDLKRGLLTESEEQLVIDLHARIGNRFYSSLPFLYSSSILAKFLRASVTQEISSPTDHQPESDNQHLQLPETDDHVNSEDNSSSPPENCSGDDSRSLDINADDPLISWLLEDATPLEDTSWKFSAAGDDDNSVGLPSWEENCTWLLDYQDFGVQEFGFGCFNMDMDMDMNNFQ
ncbi:hypothetical protein HHK36_000359 [Tetracentron sinense]|uniref:Uncharacterized protein n=1 Tax=Tetracentron sinense TaxID=13715 RepID=A0A834ZVC8_TETSI|nr:hypothetical protein HHK36_000359 [Tetracentron sinense]